MLSARWGWSMRSIGRVVAAIVLAVAVAGAAAFAHLLGSVPAGPSSVGTLPPEPASPLVVEAAPWTPDRPAAHLRPVLHPALTSAGLAVRQAHTAKLDSRVDAPR